MLRPTIARGEPPHHATIGQFTKWNAGGASLGAHAAVARICQEVARLLVRPYRCGTDLRRHLLNYVWAFSDAYKQVPTPASQPVSQLGQRRGREGKVLHVVIRGRDNGRFDYEHSHHRTAPCGGGEWGVVVNPEIAFEPDQLSGHPPVTLSPCC